jgi:integrase/recombinase XerD
MNFEDLITRFLGDLQIRNYSARTVQDYGSNLSTLRRFLEQRAITDAQSVTTATLTEFQRWFYYQPTRRDTARGVGDQNRTLATVKTFFRFLKNEGYLARDPAEAVEYAREPQRLPRNVLTPQEAKSILDTVDTTTLLGYRDRTILEVFYATGIRRSELCQLRVGDVNLEEELLRINGGKGAKDRVVPLGRIACQFLETYIKGIRPQLLKGRVSERLFISQMAGSIVPNTVRVIVQKHAKLAGIKKHMTCHVWRHTCATHLLKNNANLRHVQDLLGHRSLATTERYLRLTINDLKEAHRKFHPREQAEQR